jgi:carbamate kinase
VRHRLLDLYRDLKEGRKAIITSLEKAREAISGTAGTVIIN